MRLAFISDVHFGQMEDLRAWRFAVGLLPHLNIDEVFLGGDIYDHEAVSTHRKSPKAVTTLQNEITHGFKELERLRKACPSARIRFYRGNHERRVDKYLCGVAPALHGLKALNHETLYGLRELDIEVIKESKPVKVGHLWLAHGDEFATGSINPSAKALDAVNSNILFGHVHRVSTASKQQMTLRGITAWSNSCLCSMQPDYTFKPEWTQGFTIVDVTKAGYFSITPVTFWSTDKSVQLNTVLGGKVYGTQKTGGIKIL